MLPQRRRGDRRRTARRARGDDKKARRRLHGNYILAAAASGLLERHARRFSGRLCKTNPVKRFFVLGRHSRLLLVLLFVFSHWAMASQNLLMDITHVIQSSSCNRRIVFVPAMYQILRIFLLCRFAFTSRLDAMGKPKPFGKASYTTPVSHPFSDEVFRGQPMKLLGQQLGSCRSKHTALDPRLQSASHAAARPKQSSERHGVRLAPPQLCRQQPWQQ